MLLWQCYTYDYDNDYDYDYDYDNGEDSVRNSKQETVRQ